MRQQLRGGGETVAFQSVSPAWAGCWSSCSLGRSPVHVRSRLSHPSLRRFRSHSDPLGIQPAPVDRPRHAADGQGNEALCSRIAARTGWESDPGISGVHRFRISASHGFGGLGAHTSGDRERQGELELEFHRVKASAARPTGAGVVSGTITGGGARVGIDRGDSAAADRRSTVTRAVHHVGVPT